MRRLIFDSAPADFDFAEDIALGPWCFTDAGWDENDWIQTHFPQAFDTCDDWLEANYLTRRLANQLIPVWAERMNSSHGRTYSSGFWRMLLLPILNGIIMLMWFRYRLISRFIAANPDVSFSVTIRSAAAVASVANTAELYEFFQKADVPAWLTSRLIEVLAPASWRVVVNDHHNGNSVSAAPISPPNDTAGFFSRCVWRVVGRLPFDSVPGAGWTKILFSAYIALLPRKGKGRIYYTYNDKEIFSRFPQTFLEVLDDCLWRLMPVTLTSGFGALEAKARRQRYVRGRLLIDSLSTYSDERRIGHAFAHEAGERLVSSQHGGWSYAYSRLVGVYPSNEVPYHAFVTWGWTAQEDLRGRLVPLPAPALSSGRYHQNKKTEKLLLIGTVIHTRGNGLNNFPRSDDSVAYREAKLTFLTSLPDQIRANAEYRPYMRAHQGLPDMEFIHAGCPDIAIATGDFDAAISRCKLIVLDHPGTTLPYAYASDFPTICFWKPGSWPLSRQAQPLFDALVEAGLVFADPQSAAHHVATVWNDVDGWWHSAKVQAARKAWVHAYARISPFWWWDWTRALWQLSRD